MTNNKYKKTIAIVGAGLAGLSTGCYAQRNGDESHIFEHHRLPSGVVAAWKRKEYIFDGRVHFWTGTLSKGSKYSICEELGITRSHQFIPMDEYCLITDEASGVTVSISNDLDRLWNDMKGISSGDTEIIDLLA